MERFDNSYTSWGWYNEVLEHRNSGSMFEADEENQKPEETTTGNANGEPNDDKKNPSGKDDKTGDAGTGEDDTTGGDDEGEPEQDENAEQKKKKSGLISRIFGKKVEFKIKDDKWTEYAAENDPSPETVTRAGDDLIKLQDSFAESKIAAYNPWKMTWRTHPDNIAAQLKYLFPTHDGSWKIWEPEFKDIKKYDSKNVRSFGDTSSVDGFDVYEHTLCEDNDFHCSFGILLNGENKPISKVFNGDLDDLKKLAEKTGFQNPVNIDILGLIANKDNHKEYVEKMKNNHYKGADMLDGDFPGKTDVYAKDLYKRLPNNYANIKEMIENRKFSDEADIKTKDNLLKNIFIDQKKQDTSKNRNGTENNKSCIIKGAAIEKFIKNALLEADYAYVSDREDSVEAGDTIPRGVFDSLYSITKIERKDDSIIAHFQSKNNFKQYPSYKADDDGNVKREDGDGEHVIIVITTPKKSKYGIEMSRILFGKIFTTERKKSYIGSSVETTNITKTNYLSPLIGLDLSGIRQEIMESSRLDVLLEEMALNDIVPKGSRGKAPKYIKHPYKGLNGGITYKGIKQHTNGAARTMWIVPSDSDPSKTYNVQIDVEVPGKGGLFAIARKKNRKPGELSADRDNLRTSNIRLYCTCPDYHFGGIEYNLDQKNAAMRDPDLGGKNPGDLHKYTTKDGKEYEKGFPTPVKPIKRDPEGKKELCKHMHAVLLEFRKKIRKIFSDAKNAPADLEKVGSFTESTGKVIQAPDIMNDLEKTMLQDTTEQTQTEPIEQTEQAADQTENRGENVELVSEGEPEEYAAESEPEQSSEEDLADETVPEEDNGVENNKGLFARIKDGLRDLKDKAGNALGRIFRHEDCELAGHLIERALESNDPRVIQDSVNRIAVLLEANGKHEYAKSILESVYTDSKKSMK